MTIKEIRKSGINDTYEVKLKVNNFDTATVFLRYVVFPLNLSGKYERSIVT